MEQVTDLFNLKIYFFILFNSKLGILCFMTYNINNLTMKKEEISKFYSDNEKRYRYFSQEVESLLKNLFSNNSIEYDHMEKRVKDIDRVIDKIYRKNYSDPFTEMTDIIGHRIVVHDKNDVQIIRELISEEFNITECWRAPDFWTVLNVSLFLLNNQHPKAERVPHRCAGQAG